MSLSCMNVTLMLSELESSSTFANVNETVGSEESDCSWSAI